MFAVVPKTVAGDELVSPLLRTRNKRGAQKQASRRNFLQAKLRTEGLLHTDTVYRVVETEAEVLRGSELLRLPSVIL